jgi:hypothetical protein
VAATAPHLLRLAGGGQRPRSRGPVLELRILAAHVRWNVVWHRRHRGDLSRGPDVAVCIPRVVDELPRDLRGPKVHHYLPARNTRAGRWGHAFTRRRTGYRSIINGALTTAHARYGEYCHARWRRPNEFIDIAYRTYVFNLNFVDSLRWVDKSDRGEGIRRRGRGGVGRSAIRRLSVHVPCGLRLACEQNDRAD